MVSCTDCGVMTLKWHGSRQCRDCYNKRQRERPTRKLRLAFYNRTQRERTIRYQYNMSLEEYNRLYDAQDGRCAICKQLVDKLYVDHDHKTGKVRGLLCQSCNFAIGHFREDPEIIQKAINYIEGHKVDE